jgi:hypothetical protein
MSIRSTFLMQHKLRLLPLLLVGATACGTSWAQSTTPATAPDATGQQPAPASQPTATVSASPVGHVLAASSQPTSRPATPAADAPQTIAGSALKGPPLRSVRLRDTREAADRSRVGEINVKVNTTPTGAKIYYGRKLLGKTPFVLKAKRGSTPLDVVVKYRGYMTLRTRLRRKVHRTYNFKLSPAKIR